MNRRPGRSWFFPAMAGVAVLAVLIGFGRTYALPMARGTFRAPWVVHLHGAFAASWVLLFAVQPLLVRWGGLRWHRRIGWIAIPVAVGVAVTMIPAGLFQRPGMRRPARGRRRSRGCWAS